MLTLQDQLEKTSRQLETSQQTVKRLETCQDGGGSVAATPTTTRRCSMTPHKRESSITIGTSAADTDNDNLLAKVKELEAKLAEKEQETKDLEVKLFEASFVSQTDSKHNDFFNEDAPLPANKAKAPASRNLFDDQPLPTASKRQPEPSQSSIANRHKGSSISFSYNNTPPDQRKPGKYPSADVFKTPSHSLTDHVVNTPLQPPLHNLARDQSDHSSRENDSQSAVLEQTLKTKDTELARLRIDLASAQSKLEQIQTELKKKNDEVGRKESQVGKLQLDIDNQISKVKDLESRLAKQTQENQCQIQNAEAVKKGLEAKLKDQEKELKSEAAEAQSLVNSLTKQIEEVKKQMSQEKTAALQSENQIKTQLEKVELEKR